MSKEDVVIPGLPKNIKEVVDGNYEGYKLRRGYFLQLKHGLMGFFPAIIPGEDRVVVSLDPELLREVWAILPPRRSEMVSNLFYVNEELGVGFPILETNDFGMESSRPDKMLTREEFSALIAAEPTPFRWARGLVGNDMTREEFLETIKEAALRRD